MEQNSGAFENYDRKAVQSLIHLIDTETAKQKNTPNFYTFQELYAKKGEDLADYYKKHDHTQHEEQIKDDFVHSKTPSHAASLAEKLPLLANTPGRLGDYVKAKVTKTLKQDDQGNSFIDLVVEVTNEYVAQLDQESPKKMTLLIDVGTNTESKSKKEYALQKGFLDKALKASVKCYSDGFGLGIERPKLLVFQEPHFMNMVGEELGSFVVQHASDSFSITREREFNEAYRKYFTDLMKAVEENALASIHYIEDTRRFTDKYHRGLVDEYKKIARFAGLYAKTPTRRSTGGTS